jgi:hypothetical protein
MDLVSLSELLGNFREFVGSFAILVTLVYLSIQVKQGREEQRVAGRQTREDSIRDQQMRLATSPAVAATLAKAKDAVGESPRGFVALLVT